MNRSDDRKDNIDVDDDRNRDRINMDDTDKAEEDEERKNDGRSNRCII